ncbi:MAG: translation initiation factor IF-3 [Nitratireductor sp.]|nr:translation initiation factor IF-3 [Nitratireductor sp.]MCC0021611.1 translation initiation factor IF-3 [Nitratireductor sp.]
MKRGKGAAGVWRNLRFRTISATTRHHGALQPLSAKPDTVARREHDPHVSISHDNGNSREFTTIRRPHRAKPPVKEGPRTNEEIRIPEVQLIDAEGENRGVVPTAEALQMAFEAGLDLVEIAPTNQPPICKILDYGKFKYQQQKKAAEARKKQKTQDVKEIKMRPNIDTHDYDVKMRAVKKFLGEGDKVKVTLRFRGREMAHLELGMELLNRVKADVEEISKIEAEPKLEGRQMMMVVAPAR